MGKVLFIIFSCTLFSCSTTYIKSTNSYPVVFDKKEDHNKNIEMQLTKEFFLWGSIPFNHEVMIDKELVKQGYENVSAVEIIPSNTATDILWTIVTFGVYWPQTYKIKAKTI